MTTIEKKVKSIVNTETVYKVDGFDLEDLTEEIYGSRIEITESSNNQFYEFHVGNMSNRHKEILNIAIKKGSLSCVQYGVILNDLCGKGYLQPGKYMLTVSW